MVVPKCLKLISNHSGIIWNGFPKKGSCYFGFCPNERGGVPSPNFVSNSNEIKLISLGNTTRINLIFGAFDLLSSAFGAIVVIAPALVICSKNDNTGCGFRVQTAATNIWVEDSSTGGRSAEDILLDLIGYFSLINS